MIDRKTAETARRTAIRIDNMSKPDGVDLAIRKDCVRVWNEFCAAEERRLSAKPSDAMAIALTYRKLGWS